MRVLTPSKRDLADARLVIQSFESNYAAWGTGSELGQRPPSLDWRALYLMFVCDPDQMADLWRFTGINTGPDGDYELMCQSNTQIVDFRFFKVRKGLWSFAWIGNVVFNLDGRTLPVGSVAGRYQADMWHHFREYLGLRQNVYGSTNEAIAAM